MDYENKGRQSEDASPLAFPRSWLRPAIGLLGFSLLGLGVYLAVVLSHGGNFALDSRILLALRRPGQLAVPIGPSWLEQSAIDISALGGFTLMWLFGGGAIVLLLRARRSAEAGWFAASLIGASLLNTILKDELRRPRPELVPHLEHVSNSSFPSGHAMISAAVCLTLAFMIGEAWPRARRVAVVLCTLVVVMIGMSRIYLGVHWPSDVLAGWSFGTVWALCILLLRHRQTPA